MTIALGASGGEVKLFLDEQGRKELAQLLNELEVSKDRSTFEHFHLFSSEWGRGELSTLKVAVCEKLGVERIHHFKVSMHLPMDAMLEE